MPNATVHLVDDDESFLLAASRFLRASGYKVKAFRSASDFLAEPLLDASGCVISDLCMPEMGGLDFQEAMRKIGHVMPVIFLTGNADIPSTVTAMRQGAADFLEKRAPKEHLLAAVEKALNRDRHERVERDKKKKLLEIFDSLSTREKQVLEMVIRGAMNKEISAELGIHERTVKLHRTSITTKLGVHSAAELTHFWLMIHG